MHYDQINVDIHVPSKKINIYVLTTYLTVLTLASLVPRRVYENSKQFMPFK